MRWADQEAHRRNRAVSPETILLGLVEENGSVAVQVLKSMGIDPQVIQREVTQATDRVPDGAGNGLFADAERGLRVIENALKEARGLQHHYVGTENLLLGLFHVTDGAAFRVLSDRGLTLDRVRQEVQAVLGYHKKLGGAGG